jgi:2-methylcitrate dehydratase PrpD
LLHGEVGSDDFADEQRRDPERLALARRIKVLVDNNPDPNALTPVTVSVRLRDGRALSRSLDLVYGNPAKPMSREAHLAKFRRNVGSALEPLPRKNADAVIEMVEQLEDVEDVRHISELLVPTA